MEKAAEALNALVEQGRIELPPSSRPPTLMDVIATAGVDKLPMLWELYERQQKMDAEKAFNQAMALVQERMQPVLKEADNPITHSKYARLEHIDKAIRPIYANVGLSMTFNSGPASSPSGVLVTCDLRHVGGHVKAYQLEGQLDNIGAKGAPTKTMIHGLGSTISYLRRYLTVMIFNIPLTNEDDDGNGGREQGEPVYQHGGWEGSGSQAQADQVRDRKIIDLQERQADLKAGRSPKTAEPPLEEALQASVDQAKGPKSKNFKMLEAFGELKKRYQAIGREASYYGILSEYGKAKSNEFLPSEAKEARACYRAMGKDIATLEEATNQVGPNINDCFDDWPDNPPDNRPFAVAGVIYRYNDVDGNYRIVK